MDSFYDLLTLCSKDVQEGMLSKKDNKLIILVISQWIASMICSSSVAKTCKDGMLSKKDNKLIVLVISQWIVSMICSPSVAKTYKKACLARRTIS